MSFEVEARLEAEATQQGLPLSEYALNKLTAPPLEQPHKETAGEGILRIAQETFWTLPEEEMAKLPSDFAVNHDHYLHGARKVEHSI